MEIRKAPRETRERTFTSIDSGTIDKVRKRFLSLVSEKCDEFNSIDIRKVETDDWPIYRQLSFSNGNVEKALQGLVSTLRWRHTIDLRSLDDAFFPDLIWRVGPLFLYEPDNLGRPTLYSRCKFVMGIKDISQWEQLFTAYQIWRIDEAADGFGWTLIMDFADSGIRNADLDLLKFFLNLLMYHFPRGIDVILVANIPFILRMFWSLVKTWIPSDRVDMVKFVDNQSIREYIDQERLPDFLGGTANRPYKGLQVCPKNCPDIFTFGDKVMKLPNKRMEEIYKTYEPLMNL